MDIRAHQHAIIYRDSRAYSIWYEPSDLSERLQRSLRFDDCDNRYVARFTFITACGGPWRLPCNFSLYEFLWGDYFLSNVFLAAKLKWVVTWGANMDSLFGSLVIFALGKRFYSVIARNIEAKEYLFNLRARIQYFLYYTKIAGRNITKKKLGYMTHKLLFMKGQLPWLFRRRLLKITGVFTVFPNIHRLQGL